MNRHQHGFKWGTAKVAAVLLLVLALPGSGAFVLDAPPTPHDALWWGT